MSNQSLTDALNAISLESQETTTVELDLGDDVTLMGAEEILVVTDETSTDLEDTLNDIGAQVDKLEARNAAAETIADTVESLESAVADLHSMRERGVALSGDARNLWFKGVTASLEARRIPENAWAGDLQGLSASFESSDVADYSTEAEEKAGNVLQRLLAMLKSAAAGIKQFFVEFYQKLTGHIESFKKAGAKLSAIGAKLKGDAKEGKLKGSSYGALVIDGGVHPVKALQAVESVYTASIKTLEHNLLAAAKAGDDVSKVNFTTPSTKLPGGATVYFAGGKLVLGKNGATGADFDPLSPSEIKSLGDELTKFANVLSDANKAGQQAIKDLDAVIKAAEVNVKKGEGASGLTKESKDAIVADLKAQRKTLSSISSVSPAYLKYASGVASAAYRVGKASASKYGKAAEEAGAGTGAAA